MTVLLCRLSASIAFHPAQMVSTQCGRNRHQKAADTFKQNRVFVLDATVKSQALEKHPFWGSTAVPQSIDRPSVFRQSYLAGTRGISRKENEDSVNTSDAL